MRQKFLSNSSPNSKYLNKAFWSQNQTFLFLRKFFHLDTFDSVNLKCGNTLSKLLVQKNPNKAFLVLNLGVFFFHEIWQLEKIDGAEFKYGNVIFNLQPKNTQIKHFWYQIQIFSFFFRNFGNQINSRALISKMNMFLFFNSSQKYPNMTFSLKTQKFFMFKSQLGLHCF